MCIVLFISHQETASLQLYMIVAAHKAVYTFAGKEITLLVPDRLQIQQHYTEQLTKDQHAVFPYWSKIWASAIAMCDYLVGHTHYIQDKKLLELAAGLGLPSLLSTAYAQEVHCTDHLDEAVLFAQRSATSNAFLNMHCAAFDWRNAVDFTCDVLLLSDINYDAAVFDELYLVLLRFLDRGTTIILSTPQRLMAKPFVDQLLPFCIERDERIVDHEQQQTAISILVLRKATASRPFEEANQC